MANVTTFDNKRNSSAELDSTQKGNCLSKRRLTRPGAVLTVLHVLTVLPVLPVLTGGCGRGGLR